MLPNRWNEEHRREGNVWLSVGEQRPVLVIASKAAQNSLSVLQIRVCRDVVAYFASVQK